MQGRARSSRSESQNALAAPRNHTTAPCDNALQNVEMLFSSRGHHLEITPSCETSVRNFGRVVVPGVMAEDYEDLFLHGRSLGCRGEGDSGGWPDGLFYTPAVCTSKTGFGVLRRRTPGSQTFASSLIFCSPSLLLLGSRVPSKGCTVSSSPRWILPRWPWNGTSLIDVAARQLTSGDPHGSGIAFDVIQVDSERDRRPLLPD